MYYWYVYTLISIYVLDNDMYSLTFAFSNTNVSPPPRAYHL